MDFLNLMLAVSEPKGMWESLIKWIQGGVGNYALTIIILTLIIKVAMLPFDFYQRYVGKVNARKQAKLQPAIDKLNARYGHNKDLLNQKTMELYKRENYNLVGTCVGMMTYMVITLVVFFTMFKGINNMQYYNIDKEYLQLQQTYITTVEENYAGTEELFDDKGNFIWSVVKDLDEDTVTLANKSVLAKYEEIRTKFLWIKNVWIPDNWSAVIPNYNKYLKNINQKASSNKEKAANDKLAYNTVMSPLMEKYNGEWNGYMLLPILAIGLTLLSATLPQIIEKAKAKRKGVPYVQPQQAQIMLFVMPIILGLFTLFYNAVFALYIVFGAIFSLITTPLMTLAVVALDNKKSQKEENYTVADYSRRKPVDITNQQNTTNNKANKQNNKTGELKGITKGATKDQNTTKNSSNNSQNKNSKNNKNK